MAVPLPPVLAGMPAPVLAAMPSMAPWLLAATGISVLNVVMLAALTTVWLRNYRTFRTPMTAGLAAFGALLLIENLVAIYFYVSTRMLYSGDALAQQTVVVLRVLELLAVGFLTYVTMQ
jgi:hypothetical protein